jgi:hypothetical protein
MDHLDLLQLHILRMSPEHSQHQVVHQRNWLVYILEKHVQEILHKTQFKTIE